MEQSLGSHTEGLLRHLGRTTEAIRLEIMTANRDEMAIAMGKIVNMSDYVAGLSKEIEYVLCGEFVLHLYGCLFAG